MIVIYGAKWCKPCNETKKFFDDNCIEYQYVDADAKENQENIDKKKISALPYIELYNEDNELINTFVGSITSVEEFNKNL